MIPNFEIFGKTFSAYMILALIGYLVILFVTVKIAKNNGLDEIHMLYMILFAAIGVFLGGHFLYGITNINIIIKLIQTPNIINSFSDFIDYIVAIFGGSVFYGGMIGAAIVALIYVKKNKLNPKEYLSAAVIAIPLFHFFGRLGCFLSGCCYGIEWKYGIVYHHATVESANNIPRFPVQLVEAAVNICLFFLLLMIYTRTKYRFKTIIIYLFIYPLCRFFLEYLRGDDYRGFLFGLSTSQIISLLLIVSAIVLFIIDKINCNRLQINKD